MKHLASSSKISNRGTALNPESPFMMTIPGKDTVKRDR